MVARGAPAELATVLVAPNRELARQFASAAAESGSFSIVADFHEYPGTTALEDRLRRQQPDVAAVDFTADAQAAEELTRYLMSARPAVAVIGLHDSRDPNVMLNALRVGASEFLHAPFEVEGLREAADAILRKREPAREPGAALGRVLAFASAKPGSGASTLACHSAFAIGRLTGQRVLLADLDLAAGAQAFYLRLKHPQSCLDALEQAGLPQPAPLAALAAPLGSVEVLPAPEWPYQGAVESGLLQRFFEGARREYGWTVLDLPAVFHRLSLQAFWESDHAFIVSTAELPGLYLARKALHLVGQLGLGKDRVQVLVNRTEQRDRVSRSDLKKLFDQPVEEGFPYDGATLHRTLSHGEPLEAASALGRAVEEFVRKLAGGFRRERRPAGLLWEASPVLSGT